MGIVVADAVADAIAAPPAASRTLFIATDLSSWETTDPELYAPDVVVNGRAYRRLDARYYAWLRYRMALVRKAVETGQVQAAPYQDLRVRFNAIHAWAIENLGQAELREVVRGFDATAYSPPHVEVEGPDVALYPDTQTPAGRRDCGDGVPTFMVPVSPAAMAKADAIRERALALGWSEARLYQNRGRYAFPSGEDYGLVCFVRPDETIVEVTRQAIAIQGASGNTLRFYNPDVEQPWMRKVPVPAS